MSGNLFVFTASVLAIGAFCCDAQTAGAISRKQVDIGAAAAPLTDQERVDLDAAVRKHDYSAEKAVMEKAGNGHPQSFELLVLWGRLAYLEKHPNDAVEALERAGKIKELAEPDRLTLALAFQFSGKPDQSRSELLKLIQLAPKNGEYPYLLGRVDRLNERVEEAAKDFAKAIQLDPSLVRAYEELGQAQETLGRLEEARKTYEAGARANRSLKTPWERSPLDLGVVLLQANHYGGAEKLFGESLQYNPRFGLAHYYMGQLFHKQGRDAEAMDEYKAALVDDPRLREAWLALGRDFKRQGNEAEAERALAIFKKLEEEEDAARRKKQ